MRPFGYVSLDDVRHVGKICLLLGAFTGALTVLIVCALLWMVAG